MSPFLFWVFTVLSASSFASEVKLEFWHSMTSAKGKLLQEIVREFNSSKESQGRVKVEMQFIGSYEEGLNKTRTALLAKRGPHIVQITDIGTQVMIDSGGIVPVETFSAGDPLFPTKELLPQIRRYYEVKGKLYSLPFATSNPILYYNVDLLKKAGISKPPATFVELQEVARKLTDAKEKRFGITWPLHSWFVEQFLARQGALFVNQENGRAGRATEAVFTSPQATRFLEMWSAMVKEGTFANVGRGWDPAEANFLAGRSAMFITSTSDVFEVASKAPFAVMTAPIPTADRNVVGGTIVGGNSLWILNGKPVVEQKLAYEFVRFMASKSAQRKWHVNTGYFPIRSDLVSDLEKEGFYKKNPAAKTAVDQLRASADIPATKGALIGVFSEVREHVDSAIENILSGRQSVADALGKAKTMSDAAMARYNRGRDKTSVN